LYRSNLKKLFASFVKELGNVMTQTNLSGAIDVMASENIFFIQMDPLLF